MRSMRSTMWGWVHACTYIHRMIVRAIIISSTIQPCKSAPSSVGYVCSFAVRWAPLRPNRLSADLWQPGGVGTVQQSSEILSVRCRRLWILSLQSCASGWLPCSGSLCAGRYRDARSALHAVVHGGEHGANCIEWLLISPHDHRVSLCSWVIWGHLKSPQVYTRTCTYMQAVCNSSSVHFLCCSVAPHIDAIKAAVASPGDQLTPREHGYIRAVLAYASGNLFKAFEEFCSVLMENPLGMFTRTHAWDNKYFTGVCLKLTTCLSADALAVSLIVFSCIMVGEFERMRDTIARVLVFWTEHMELYPYILALYAHDCHMTSQNDSWLDWCDVLFPQLQLCSGGMQGERVGREGR